VINKTETSYFSTNIVINIVLIKFTIRYIQIICLILSLLITHNLMQTDF